MKEHISFLIKQTFDLVFIEKKSIKMRVLSTNGFWCTLNEKCCRSCMKVFFTSSWLFSCIQKLPLMMRNTTNLPPIFEEVLVEDFLCGVLVFQHPGIKSCNFLCSRRQKDMFTFIKELDTLGQRFIWISEHRTFMFQKRPFDASVLFLLFPPTNDKKVSSSRHAKPKILHQWRPTISRRSPPPLISSSFSLETNQMKFLLLSSYVSQKTRTSSSQSSPESNKNQHFL